MPARELRPITERVYWLGVGSLDDHPDELVEKAIYVLRADLGVPELLARLAEDDLLDPEARQGVETDE
ncbi:MAG TPA: hypothetical protein VNV42_12265 [Solirubrobacteraceae bacterium]|jgi:hypothetical protein|nr:hypothetical protein [Solirubrobacteraceae bacterium]